VSRGPRRLRPQCRFCHRSLLRGGHAGKAVPADISDQRYCQILEEHVVSYEGRREARGAELDADARLDLLKLKFSRAWLCFTGLAYLLLGEDPGYFPRRHARRMVDLTPVSRMVEIAERVPDLTDLIEDILQAYAAWLGRAGQDKADLVAWVNNDDNYRTILEPAQQFGDLMRDVVNALGNGADLSACTTCLVRGLEIDVSRSRSKANRR
jgi:hypothetical protein